MSKAKKAVYAAKEKAAATTGAGRLTPIAETAAAPKAAKKTSKKQSRGK